MNKEVRILNRILRLDDEGLTYEADPRHVELLARSLNLDNCRECNTTGSKPEGFNAEEEEEETAVNADGAVPADHLVAAQLDEDLTLPRRSPSVRMKVVKHDGVVVHIRQQLQFDEHVTVRTVQIPYSKTYGLHPSKIVFVGPVGSNGMRLVSPNANAYTGIVMSLSPSHMHEEIREHTKRTEILRAALLDGACWETSSAERMERFMMAMSKQKKPFTKKRLGARAVKEQELLANTGDVLTDLQATTFRALAARANYLSMDRADIAFSSKELCRAFARPTSADVAALKHLVRYLVWNPRAVYKFRYQHVPTAIRVCVDTDFAGDLASRRSTSGGMIFLGAHQIKHWSSTQSVIALSSGEAKLIGIVKGASNGLG